MKKIVLIGITLLIALMTVQAIAASCHHNSITGSAIFDGANTGSGGNLTLLILLGFAAFIALITLGIIDRK